MKTAYLLILLLFWPFTILFAQDRLMISGMVTDAETGLPLPGVNILISGTTEGNLTDMEGNYSIQVESGRQLQFSFVGYESQRFNIGSQTIIDVKLLPDIRELEEVVVTSLGIEREKKALGYSIMEVEGDKLTEARENNLANQLQGRVAGINVTSVSGGPASSSRVIIRGNKSLNGNNQPLYVVDGIPVDNRDWGQAGMWGGVDWGDGMTSFNPDDIESIQVLKGASAAALYGSRAANGVINITTKKGMARKGIGVEFLSNFVFDVVYDQRDLQREYGQGNYVLSDPTNGNSPRIAVAPRDQQEAFGWGTSSWGPRLDSLESAIQFDGVIRPYSDAGDNWPRFYQTGGNWTNTLALTGGSERQNFRFSVSDLRNTSIIPNSGFNRQNLSFSTNSKFNERLTLTAKVLYSHEKTNNRPGLSDSPGNAILSMYYIPANVNVNDYRGDLDKLGAIPQDIPESSLDIWNFGRIVGDELPPSDNRWHQNPWWVAYQMIFKDTRDRIITSGQLKYDINDFLYIQGQIGMDWSTRRGTSIWPQGTGGDWPSGWIQETQDNVREINMDYMFGLNKTFGKISVNAFLGGNMMRVNSERILIYGSSFNVPFFNAINNTANRIWIYNYEDEGINSLYGQAEISYEGFLFLTATARNDWFSVLNPAYNSILYPSVGMSFVFSDIIHTLPGWFSFGKVRSSWAQAGNVTINPYESEVTYSLFPISHLEYPMASYSTAMGGRGLIPNPILQPLLSTEMEAGLDVRFFDNRLGFDFTYYHQKTTDDILTATISTASGFARTYVNLGEMRNRGFEVLLNGSPLRGTFNWDISLNFARNVNKVVSLTDEFDELIIGQPRNRNVFIKHIVGQPFGVITGRVQKISPPYLDPEYGCITQGKPVFYSDGRMDATDEFVIIGDGNPDWTGGLNNTLTWKSFNLSFLIDFKLGGDIISGTNMRLTAAGLHKQSLIGREGEEPLKISGVTQTGVNEEGDPIYEPFGSELTPSQAQAYWQSSQSDKEGITDMYLYDASFAKLRQLTFGYTFPRQVLSRTPFNNLSLSFVGRNLLVLWKNIDNVDPESSYNNGNAQGLEYFAMSAVRSYGFNLKAGF